MSRILLNVSDFKNVCRGCLSTTNNVNIFENMFNNIRLDELFKIFTGIEVNIYVCVYCIKDYCYLLLGQAGRWSVTKYM